ncbi:hypothetical protein V1514DRAFT_280881 [Lipomyces japonicus]|uniref:uncharacterized protein n=1 Tax=Lipomyces japonicus TaxID=56871 RepID=UPI0034CEA7E0
MSYPSPLNPVVRALNPSVTTLSSPFKRSGLFHIGARSTVISLRSGSVVVIAPLPYGPDSEAVVAGRDVKFLIAPDIVHHLALKSWKEAHPAAKIIGPAGLRQKKAADGVHVDHELTTAGQVLTPSQAGIVDDDIEHELRFVYVAAHTNHELVTFHLPTATLVEADLLFNLPANEQYSNSALSYKTGFSRLFNLLHPFGSWHARLAGASFSDKAAAATALTAIASLPFTTIVPCHGDVLVTPAADNDPAHAARPAFEAVFAKYLK